MARVTYTTDSYSKTYFMTYAKHRTERIQDGWEIADVNLITESNSRGDYVTGIVTYKKSD
jgi:hypothetical protein